MVGEKMSPSLAPRVCEALLQGSDGGSFEVGLQGAALLESTAALLHRSSQGTAHFSALDAAVKRKTGLPRGEGYLVKSARPEEPPIVTSNGVNSFPPATPVDNTMQLPPDADGDPWNTPRDGWTKNGKPAAGKR